MLRGVHIDCRGQKLKAAALINILHDLAKLNYNAIMMEYMDAFPFEGPLAKLKAPDAYTREEVIQIRDTAESLGIEIIPLVQTFGHLYWVLRDPEFMPLAEGYDPEHTDLEDITNADGSVKYTTVCPTNPATLPLIREMLTQVRALHPTARYFHIGGDEITRPECPRCQGALKKTSLGNLLSGYYSSVADIVAELGAKPIVWCDILLAYPDSLDGMKDKVAVMDWDYWSNGQPTTSTNLWGIRDAETDISHEPDKWPALQQKLFRPYVFEKEPETFKAFPYTDLLRDLGFEVILASAARCGGDSFCVPSDVHMPNVSAAAEKAAASGITGYLVTSWSIRRSAWPMTELSLAMASDHSTGTPDDEKTLLAFALRHFGVADKELADLPRLLGHAARSQVLKTDILQSLNEKSDFATGNFFAPAYKFDNPVWRIHPRDEQILSDVPTFLAGMNDLRAACSEARKRLEKADPKAAYTYLWYWAIDVFELYCDAAPLLARRTLSEEADVQAVKALDLRIQELAARTASIYRQWYTDFTIDGELQCRFTVLKDALYDRLGK